MTVSTPPAAEPRAYRWSTDEFYRLGSFGLLDDKRVELIEGTLIEMPPIHPEHATGVTRARRTLVQLFEPGYVVREQQPLHLAEGSDPQPDLAVVTGPLEDYRDRHPTTALLIVEISDTSLQYDRSTKAVIYARAGIPEYWIVNVRERKLEIRRRPARVAENPDRFVYEETTELGESESATPLGFDKSIKVVDLLP